MLYQLSYKSKIFKRNHKTMERVAGIEPTPSAWKAEVLPLNYTRKACELTLKENMVEGKDSNLRRQSRQIYSLIPLAAREPLLSEAAFYIMPPFCQSFSQ